MLAMSLPTKTLIYFIAPKLIDILQDVVESNVTEENLKAVSNRLYALAADLTGKTAFTWDDDLAKVLLDTITNPETYASWGDAILDVVEDWVAASSTQWDDMIILPATATFRKVAGIPDGDD